VYEHTPEKLRDLYRHELQVNRHKLERASQQQATVFEKWYSALEDVEGDIRDLNTDLVREKARVNLLIRRKFPSYKEGAINAKIERHKEVIKIVDTINRLKRYQSKLKGAVEAGRQRKSMIQTLKDLYIANYWDKTTSQGTPIHGRRHRKDKRK
jgi:hypothetical protein